MRDLVEQIQQRIDLLGLKTSEQQIKRFEQYLRLLEKWNKAYNLTAVRTIEEMLDRHLLDSLSITKHIQGKHLLDVGTGAGLPGIPLAIYYPENHYSLLDSNGKKTRFLQQVKIELQLENVTVLNSRIEHLATEQKYDGIISRAFASLQDMLSGSEHVCADNGYYFAMKGQYPEAELQQIDKPYKVLPITWPGNESERHLVIISQSVRGVE